MIEPVTMIGATQFGRIWVKMIRGVLMPITTQDSTNARWRRVRN